MKLNFLMDISDKSSSFHHTPNLASLKMPFYLYNFAHFYAGGNYYTEREGLDNYLLLYTISGSGKITYRNCEYLARENQAVIIDCNEYHYYKTGEEGFWNFSWIHLNGFSCGNFTDLINENSLNVVQVPKDSCLEHSFNELCILKSSNEPLIDIKFSMLLTNILTELVMNRFNKVKNDSFSQHKELVNDVFDFIHANFNKKISLDDLAACVHMSKYHFIRIFNKYTGTSPYEYLINFRINKSKVLLKETSLTVNEISLMVGYNEVTNFIRDFKKYLGTTPMKYRNYWIS